MEAGLQWKQGVLGYRHLPAALMHASLRRERFEPQSVGHATQACLAYNCSNLQYPTIIPMLLFASRLPISFLSAFPPAVLTSRLRSPCICIPQAGLRWL